MYTPILNAALEYIDNNFSVIPIVPKGKTPLISWSEYQKRVATPEEIDQWFQQWPDANIGIITGSISQVGVIDLDTTEAIEWAKNTIPRPNIIQKTGRGEQWLYKSNGRPVPQGSNMITQIQGVDCRGEGGYIVAAPSIHETGLLYEFIFSYGDWDDLPVFPYDFFKPNEGKSPLTLDPVGEGQRNDHITRLAGRYFAKGLSPQEVYLMCQGYNTSCPNPLPEQEIKTIIESIYKKEMTTLDDIDDTWGQKEPAATQRRQWGQQEQENKKAWGEFTYNIREFIEQHTGTFTNYDIDREFGILNRNEKKARSKVISRLENEGKIKKIPNSPGKFRILDYKLEQMDFSQTKSNPFQLNFPLDIGELAFLYPGNIVIVAGTSNAGKTAFLLSTIYDTVGDSIKRERKKEPKKEREKGGRMSALDQMVKKGVRYLNSELTPEEITDWEETLGHNSHEGIEFIYRSGNFQDAIKPDGINIIDYLEVYEEFYKIGADIAAIHNQLKNGIAIIAIQKKHGADHAVGGQFASWKARLVINLESVHSNVKVAKIAKLKKAVNPEDNREGMEVDYVISRNGGFRKVTDWRYLTYKQRQKTNEFYKHNGVKLPKKKTDGYRFQIQKTNGEYVGIVSETVKKWEESFSNIDVAQELMRIQDNSEDRPFLKPDGWFYQLSGVLKKKNKEAE